VNAVVDTNVIAYFLLGTDRYVDEARDFMTSLGEGWAPALWEAADWRGGSVRADCFD